MYLCPNIWLDETMEGTLEDIRILSWCSINTYIKIYFMFESYIHRFAYHKIGPKILKTHLKVQ